MRQSMYWHSVNSGRTKDEVRIVDDKMIFEKYRNHAKHTRLTDLLDHLIKYTLADRICWMSLRGV